jgi:hypothetical protein
MASYSRVGHRTNLGAQPPSRNAHHLLHLLHSLGDIHICAITGKRAVGGLQGTRSMVAAAGAFSGT